MAPLASEKEETPQPGEGLKVEATDSGRYALSVCMGHFSAVLLAYYAAGGRRQAGRGNLVLLWYSEHSEQQFLPRHAQANPLKYVLPDNPDIQKLSACLNQLLVFYPDDSQKDPIRNSTPL